MYVSLTSEQEEKNQPQKISTDFFCSWLLLLPLILKQLMIETNTEHVWVERPSQKSLKFSQMIRLYFMKDSQTRDRIALFHLKLCFAQC